MLPTVLRPEWTSNPIDHWILARLDSVGVAPSMPAGKATLLRRVSLDLLGLPPSQDSLNRFLANPSKDAYRAEVERLLASPHFGERWGRHWLDRARYADSNGYSVDAPRSMWRYRDWVIDALNADLPYDRFILEQLAGDLIPNASLQQRLATGFHRNTQINQEGGIDPEQFRIESIFDRVSTTATVFLGLTLACAQCHDHKFDPLSQTDFYRLFALFNNQEEPSLETPTPAETEALQRHSEKVRNAEAALSQLAGHLDQSVADWEKSLEKAVLDRMKPEWKKALLVPTNQRSSDDRIRVLEARRWADSTYRDRTSELDKIRRARPGVTTALVLSERPAPRPTHRFVKGDFTRPAEQVEPGTPTVLPPLRITGTQATRLDLARWLATPEHPLTSRVAANQLWLLLFGRGLVETENDFGTQGTPPSHPELLDWLASEYRDSGWSLKHMLRLIVLSSTYQQSSSARPDLAVMDPGNRLLARQNRIRLEAEIIRDSALAASGTLATQIGGPSVFPPQPDGVMALGQSRREWRENSGKDRHRRGLYTFYWRATPHPALAVFDAPDAFSACSRRLRSNTPLQALTLLNEPQFHELAMAFSQSMARPELWPDRQRIEHGFRVCVGRPPSPNEFARIEQLLARFRTRGTGSEHERSAWLAVARVLLNLDETITRE